MVIFFEDRPVILKQENPSKLTHLDHFEVIADMRLAKFKTIRLSGHVLLLNATTVTLRQVIQVLQAQPPRELLSITLVSASKKELVATLKSHFTVLKAAGGVVEKEGKWLFMYRRKVWDLPKGKLDKGEKSKKAALREIEEETGVKAKLANKICTTWHTYVYNKERIIKQTKWYYFDCIDDTHLQPQAEEDIEQLVWVAPEATDKLLVNSYSSIRFVIEKLRKSLVV